MIDRIIAYIYGEGEGEQLYSFTTGESVGILIGFDSHEDGKYDVNIISSRISKDALSLGKALVVLGEEIINEVKQDEKH